MIAWEQRLTQRKTILVFCSNIQIQFCCHYQRPVLPQVDLLYGFLQLTQILPDWSGKSPLNMVHVQLPIYFVRVQRTIDWKLTKTLWFGNKLLFQRHWIGSNPEVMNVSSSWDLKLLKIRQRRVPQKLLKL